MKGGIEPMKVIVLILFLLASTLLLVIGSNMWFTGVEKTIFFIAYVISIAFFFILVLKETMS